MRGTPVIHPTCVSTLAQPPVRMRAWNKIIYFGKCNARASAVLEFTTAGFQKLRTTSRGRIDQWVCRLWYRDPSSSLCSAPDNTVQALAPTSSPSISTMMVSWKSIPSAPRRLCKAPSGFGEELAEARLRLCKSQSGLGAEVQDERSGAETTKDTPACACVKPDTRLCVSTFFVKSRDTFLRVSRNAPVFVCVKTCSSAQAQDQQIWCPKPPTLSLKFLLQKNNTLHPNTLKPALVCNSV